MTSKSKKTASPLIDNAHAPEVFATLATGILRIQDNIAITFEASRSDYSQSPPTVNRVVIARLVMPIAGAANFAVILNGFLENQGASPSQAIVGDATRQ